MGQNIKILLFPKFLKQHYDVKFEVLIVMSMVMVMITLKIEAMIFSEISVSTRLHGTTPQKIATLKQVYKISKASKSHV
jgi:hypothetical protein